MNPIRRTSLERSGVCGDRRFIDSNSVTTNEDERGFEPLTFRMLNPVSSQSSLVPCAASFPAEQGSCPGIHLIMIANVWQPNPVGLAGSHEISHFKGTCEPLSGS